MKMVLINGSPKGKDSITLQHWLYAQNSYPELELDIINVGQGIHKLEKNPQYLDEVFQRIAQSEAILWSFPVYYIMLPSQLHRFLELIHENHAEKAFKGKSSAYFGSSIHYMDHLVDSFMYNLANRLGLISMEGHIAAMGDLFLKEEQGKILSFVERFLAHSRGEGFALKGNRYKAGSGLSSGSIDLNRFNKGLESQETPMDLKGKKLLILSDRGQDEPVLNAMVDHLRSSLTGGEWEEINLREMKLKSGCLGCIACGYDNQCRLSSMDDFYQIYQEHVIGSDLLIYALPVKYGFFPARWKAFIDRQFYKNHRPSQQGISRGFLLSGSMEDTTLLEQYMKSESHSQQCNLCGWIQGDALSGEQAARGMQQLLREMVEVRTAGHGFSQDFTAFGGRKVFRDAIFGPLRFPFRQDYKYYKKNGYFNFPQKKRKSIFMNQILLILSKFKGFRHRVYQQFMLENMVNPYRSFVQRKERI